VKLRILLAMLALAGLAPALGAQELRLERPLGNSPAERVLAGILERGQYRVLARDTVLAPTFLEPGDLIITDAEVRLEGQVTGDVAVVNGQLFIRPGARIGGTVAVLGGEVYPSRLASTGPLIRVDPRVRVTTERQPGAEEGAVAYALTVEPPPAPPRFVLPGTFGAALPTYDRVDGLRITVGAQYRFTGDTLTGPSAEVFASYASARGRFGGGAQAALPLDSTIRLTARLERATFTNERWIRGDLVNSALALVFGLDERNYYESDRLTLRVARTFNPEVRVGLRFAPSGFVLASRDRSLAAADPWSLSGGGLARENPEIDDGVLISAGVGSLVRYQGRFATFDGELGVEQGVPGVGDHGFTHGVAAGLFRTPVLWRHRISVRFRVLQPITGDVPRQRWSFVGGPGTLPFVGTGELWGDNLRFVESAYEIPLTWITLRYLGSPFLQFTQTSGVAWPSGTPEPEWRSDLGVGLRFFPGYISVRFDPSAERLRPRLGLGVAFSF
jgi:hypothetical protein